MEDLDADAQKRRETFARYGLAMYHAQCVEKSLVARNLSEIVAYRESVVDSINA